MAQSPEEQQRAVMRREAIERILRNIQIPSWADREDDRAETQRWFNLQVPQRQLI